MLITDCPVLMSSINFSTRSFISGGALTPLLIELIARGSDTLLTNEQKNRLIIIDFYQWSSTRDGLGSLMPLRPINIDGVQGI